MRAMVALAAAAALAGCTVGPDYRPPVTEAPPAFAGPQPAGEAVAERWWTRFGDPVLNRLVERALSDNPDVQAAASRVRQARLQEIVARSGGLPQVNANANATHIEFSRNAGFASLARLFSGGGDAGGGGTGSAGGVALPGSGITTYAFGFDASWEVDLFGGVRRQVEAARAQAEGEAFTRADLATTLAAEVAQAYLALRFDQQQLQVIGEELARQRGSLRIAEETARVGLVPTIDVTRQRASITDTEARIEPIRIDIDVRRHALALLVGQPPAALDSDLGGVLPPLLPAPAIPAGLPSDMLRRRADVRAAERQLAAATAGIGVAVADLYPRFSLTGAAQLLSSALGNLFSGNSLQLTATGAAQFPLVDWGRRRAAVEDRREMREQAYLRYRAVVLGALRDVEDALVRIEGERRRQVALNAAVADALASARATEAQYRTGFVAQNALLDAEAQLLSAREELVTSDAQLRQQTVSLLKALGGGWEALPTIGARPEKDRR